ncbi:hypothetical protein MP228_004554 [Amoeboaphelidium protococcarum]|nr:hypothetical protein MP228_004554 [Amoeboaphelidium protococcarum]
MSHAKVVTDYTKYLTQESLNRKPSAIRSLQPLIDLPGMISLGGGIPNVQTFPIVNISVQCRDGQTIELGKGDTAKALQYSGTQGVPQLVQWIKDLQKRMHNPPQFQSNYDVIVTNGSQDGLTKAFKMLIGPGDVILVENPTYSGSLAYLHPKTDSCHIQSVSIDQNGLDPIQLRKSIQDSFRKYGRHPKFLYTIPTGANPSSVTTSLERRREIYAICREYDLLILEDDPYYFLQYSSQYVPSYQSMDVDGRVLRFDSFSKIVSSGMRLGFVSGPSALIERIVLHEQSTNLHSSGISQMILWSIIDQLWKQRVDKFLKHCHQVASFYEQRCQVLVAACKQHLPANVTYTVPQAGMFLWLNLHCDTRSLIKEKAVESKVLLLPGIEFVPNHHIEPALSSTFVRASFSSASEEDLVEGIRRLSELLKK